MPHADAAYVPPGLDKKAFWSYVYDQLALLMEDERNWVSASHDFCHSCGEILTTVLSRCRISPMRPP